MILVAVCLIAGIAAEAYCHFDYLPLLALTMLCLLSAAVGYWRKMFTFSARLMPLLFVLFGMLLTAQHLERLWSDPLLRFGAARDYPRVTLRGYVQELSLPDPSDSLSEFIFVAEELLTDSGRERLPGSILSVTSYHEINAQLKPGMLLELTGSLRSPLFYKNISSLGYTSYLKARKIHYQLVVKNNDTVSIISTRWGSRILFEKLTYLLRSRLAEIYSAHLQEGDSALLRAMILGDRSRLTIRLRSMYIDAGVFHLLAISGFNVGIIYIFVSLLCRGFGTRRWITACISIGAILLFTILTGMPTSVLRASFMLVLLIISHNLYRSNTDYHALAASAFALLVINPLLFFDSGTQLSFAAVGSLFVLRQPFMHLFEPMRHVPYMLKDMTSSVLAANVGVLPLMIYYFHQVTPIALVSNLLIIPICSIVLLIGMLLSVAGLVSGVVAEFVGLGVAGAVFAMRWLIEVFASVPFGTITVTEIPLWLLLFFLGGLLLFITASYRAIARRERDRLYYFSLAPLALIIVIPIASSRITPSLTVAFLDVGQGAATIIHAPNSKSYVVDAGPSLRYENPGLRAIAPALESFGKGSPAAYFISHFDNDHTGGLPFLLTAYPPETFYYGAQDVTNKEFEQAMKLCEGSGTPCVQIGSGDVLDLGEDWKLRVLYPPKGVALTDSNSKLRNNESLVLLLTDERRNILISGDIQSAAEHELLNSNALPHMDAMQIPHHGSVYSSTPEFVEAMSPRFAVISAGEGKTAQDAASRTATVYRAVGSTVYTTFTDGEVRVIVTQRGIVVKTYLDCARRCWWHYR